MSLESFSPYAEAEPTILATEARQDALRGGPVGDDPVMEALYLESRQFMHGACSMLASHLNETCGMPVILLQGRPPGQGWIMRHAMACPCGAERAASLIDAGRGFEVPVLDAAGGGIMAERLPLYREEDWEYRAILGRDSDCGTRWMWEPREGRPVSDQEHVIARMPALAHALGVPFDLGDAPQASWASGTKSRT